MIWFCHFQVKECVKIN